MAIGISTFVLRRHVLESHDLSVVFLQSLSRVADISDALRILQKDPQRRGLCSFAFCSCEGSTTLQTGRSRVRFPMVSVEFFSDIIMPVALWPWGRLSL
jgi:hypothetical protein